MTVQELIEELSKYDPDMVLTIEGDQDYIDCLFPITGTMKVNTLHSKYRTLDEDNMPYELILIA